MLRNFLVGVPVMIACMALQATFVTICLQRYARFRASRSALPTQFSHFLLLSMVMLIMLFANFLRIALWAGVFVAIGEFSHFPTALHRHVDTAAEH